ncbi:MAG TPA: flavin reductase family protein [Burkholderiales bacterium]|nr:flavin reductase family protein [Burkholderiales bacterium]
MEIDIESLARTQRYKLLTSLIVPRPIALITTLSEGGVVNAAPFSYFNVFGEDPPIVMFSADARASGGPKDTAANVARHKEFVVNLVDEAIAEQMHGCAVDAATQLSEIELVGFTTTPSERVRPPRIVQSPVSLECTLHTQLDFDTRQLFIGQIRWMHVREGIIDPSTLRRVADVYRPVGRLYANRYCRTADEFTLDNSAYATAANAQSAIRMF